MQLTLEKIGANLFSLAAIAQYIAVCASLSFGVLYLMNQAINATTSSLYYTNGMSGEISDDNSEFLPIKPIAQEIIKDVIDSLKNISYICITEYSIPRANNN